MNEELLQEAMDFVNNLYIVRPYDSTCDEYMQYVLENSPMKSLCIKFLITIYM